MQKKTSRNFLNEYHNAELIGRLFLVSLLSIVEITTRFVQQWNVK